LRRCNIFNVASLFIIGLVFVFYACPSFGAVAEVDTTKWTSWPHTIFYMAHLSGPDKPYADITVNITAIDKYTLYINGSLIGSDNDWETVEKYTVNISGDDVIVAVKVENDGVGNGNGLMVDIQAGADWLGTTTMKRRSAVYKGVRIIFPLMWYYFDGTEEALKKIVGRLV